jgi:O-glycosyl hydrolase
MRRKWCLLSVFAVSVIVACNSADRPTAVRPHFTALSGLDTAVLNPQWQQQVKGWGLYPAGEDGGFNGHSAAATAVYSMNETFIRDKLDGRLYVSGTTLSNMVIDTTTLNLWITKWEAAKTAGVPNLMLSVWSPPAAFKTNGSLDGYINGDTVLADSNNVGYLKTGAETSYVFFLVKVLEYAKSKGITPVALSIQNEPNKLVTYDGCLYTNRYSQWQYVVKTAAYYLSANGLSGVAVIGPEPSHYESGMAYLGGTGFAELGSDPDLNTSLGGYAWHTYQQCGISDVKNGITAYPKDSWVTEYSAPSPSPATGSNRELGWSLGAMGVFGADFALVPNNYWAWWQSWLDTSSPPDSTTLTTGTGATINLSKRYILLKKLWQMVQPGWSVRTFEVTNDPDLKISETGQDTCAAVIQMFGFANSTNTAQVMVFVNPTTTDKSIRISPFDTNYADQNSWRTDSSNDTIPQAGSNVFKGYSTVSVPHRSVVLARLFVPGH